MRFVSRFTNTVVALGACFAAAGSGHVLAQDVPDVVQQEVLIKNSLLTFNDANVTGIYTVLHARLSAQFREQFPVDKLKVTFKRFVDKHVDFNSVAVKPLTPEGEPKLDAEGVLALNGKIVVSTKLTLQYHLKYIRSEGAWKLWGIHVNVDSPPSVSITFR